MSRYQYESRVEAGAAEPIRDEERWLTTVVARQAVRRRREKGKVRTRTREVELELLGASPENLGQGLWMVECVQLWVNEVHGALVLREALEAAYLAATEKVRADGVRHRVDFRGILSSVADRTRSSVAHTRRRLVPLATRVLRDCGREFDWSGTRGDAVGVNTACQVLVRARKLELWKGERLIVAPPTECGLKRSEPRRLEERIIPVYIRKKDLRIPGVLVETSPGGLRVWHRSKELKKGARVLIDLPQHSLCQVTVVWSRAGRAGLQHTARESC